MSAKEKVRGLAFVRADAQGPWLFLLQNSSFPGQDFFINCLDKCLLTFSLSSPKIQLSPRERRRGTWRQQNGLQPGHGHDRSESSHLMLTLRCVRGSNSGTAFSNQLLYPCFIFSLSRCGQARAPGAPNLVIGKASKSWVIGKASKSVIPTIKDKPTGRSAWPQPMRHTRFPSRPRGDRAGRPSLPF